MCSAGDGRRKELEQQHQFGTLEFTVPISYIYLISMQEDESNVIQKPNAHKQREHRTQRIKVSHNLCRSASTTHRRCIKTFARPLATLHASAMHFNLSVAGCVLRAAISLPARAHSYFPTKDKTAYCSSLSAFIFFLLISSSPLLLLRLHHSHCVSYWVLFSTAHSCMWFLLVEQGWLWALTKNHKNSIRNQCDPNGIVLTVWEMADELTSNGHGAHFPRMVIVVSSPWPQLRIPFCTYVTNFYNWKSIARAIRINCLASGSWPRNHNRSFVCERGPLFVGRA